MPESEDIIRRRCEMFESYCKTVLRNCARDLERAARRREDREILTGTPLEYAQVEMDDEDSYAVMCRDAPRVVLYRHNGRETEGEELLDNVALYTAGR